MKKFIFFLLTLISLITTAQTNCGCNKTLTAGTDGGIYFPDGSSVLPGQKLCIAAGTYTYISLGNIKGTAAAPITIINCGGSVRSTGSAGYGIRIVRSKYFRITGTGTPGILYGMGTRGIPPSTPAGISIMDSATDYEVDHLELQNTGVGIFTSKPPVDSDPGTWSTGWTNKNLSYHDNYIHNAGGEAMYLGATSSSYSVLDVNGTPITVEPVLQDNVSIYNNYIDSAGWDGIQLASSPNSTIHDNIVKNFGLKNLPVQQAGIIFGGKCSGTVYNNYIFNGTGNGMQIFGNNLIKVYNNVVVNAGWDGTAIGQDGIIIDDRPQPNNKYSGQLVYLMNNTVINAAGHAVRLYNSYATMATGQRVVNNLLIKPNSPDALNDKFIVIGTGLTVVNTNNVKRMILSDANFISAATNDYHLSASSPAVDSGANVSLYGVSDDYDHLTRPKGSSYDVGAYEFNAATQPPPVNKPPIVNAGPDVTITLPVGSGITLHGIATDSDGTITSYLWTPVGQYLGSFTGSTTANLSLANFGAGICKFELKVTDNAGAIARDTVAFTVLPPEPIKVQVYKVSTFDGTKTFNATLYTKGTDSTWSAKP